MALASRPPASEAHLPYDRTRSTMARRNVAQQGLDLYATLIATIDPVERIYVEFDPDAIVIHGVANNISHESRLEVYAAQRKVREQYPAVLWHFTLFDRRNAEDTVLDGELALHRVLNMHQAN